MNDGARSAAVVCWRMRPAQRMVRDPLLAERDVGAADGFGGVGAGRDSFSTVASMATWRRKTSSRGGDGFEIGAGLGDGAGILAAEEIGLVLEGVNSVEEGVEVAAVTKLDFAEFDFDVGDGFGHGVGGGEDEAILISDVVHFGEDALEEVNGEDGGDEEEREDGAEEEHEFSAEHVSELLVRGGPAGISDDAAAGRRRRCRAIGRRGCRSCHRQGRIRRCRRRGSGQPGVDWRTGGGRRVFVHVEKRGEEGVAEVGAEVA